MPDVVWNVNVQLVLHLQSKLCSSHAAKKAHLGKVSSVSRGAENPPGVK